MSGLTTRSPNLNPTAQVHLRAVSAHQSCFTCFNTAILSLLHHNSDPSLYFTEVNKLVQWCDEHYLVINTNKTEEIVLDPRSVGDRTALSKHSREIKQVTSYRCLGIHLNNLFSFNDHVDYVCSRLQQRLYFLRRLRVFGVSQKILFLFYQAVLESIMRYGMAAWFGNPSAQSKSKLQRLVQTAMKVMGGTENLSLQAIYEQSVLRQAQGVLSDPSHILYTEFKLLPSGRRYTIPTCRLNCFKHSFVPTPITILNSF